MNIKSKILSNTTFLFKLIKIANIFNRKPVYIGNGKILAQLAYGQRIILDSNDLSLTPNIATFGLWEPDITQVFLNSLKEGMTVLEIGANIGYFTLLASHKIGPTGKVYSFEANPSTFSILHNNIDINGLLDRVIITNKAIYSESTKLAFNSLSKHHGGSSIVSFNEDTLKFFNDTCTTIEVDAISIDDFFYPTPPSIDLIKIDAEGSEPFIFKGMKRLLDQQKKITIICEFNQPLIKGAGENPEDFLKQIISYNFNIKKISKNGKTIDCTMSDILNETMCELYLTRQ